MSQYSVVQGLVLGRAQAVEGSSVMSQMNEIIFYDQAKPKLIIVHIWNGLQRIVQLP